jgi:hypothetical protein
VCGWYSTRRPYGLIPLIVTVAICAGWCSPAATQNVPPQLTADVGLTIVASDRIEPATPNQAVYDFGKASLLDQTMVEQDFTIRNDSKSQLTVSRLQSSCGCTTAILRSSDGTSAVLAPGGQTGAHVTVNLAGLHAGPIHKLVEVYVEGNPLPAAILKIEGELTPAVTFSPSALSFGRVQAGAEHHLTLTTTLDSRLAGPRGRMPTLLSSDPSIRVRPIPAPAGASGPARTQAYEVTLAANAPLGFITGQLEFAASRDLSSVVSRALSGASAAVSAQISGDITVQPQVVAFGAVQQGHEASRQLILAGSPAVQLESIVITSESAQLSAKLEPMSPAHVGKLNVRLSAHAAAGLFRSQLALALPNGQRLLIPVSAYITR